MGIGVLYAMQARTHSIWGGFWAVVDVAIAMIGLMAVLCFYPISIGAKVLFKNRSPRC